jgi:hypothetical protein
MRKSLGIIPVLLFAALIAPNAHADIYTDYTITFALTRGSINVSAGSFTYDDTSGQFTSFTLLWDGIDFDLTSSANAPSTVTPGLPSCLTSTSGAAAGLSLLTSCSTDQQSFWSGDLCATCGPQVSFVFQDTGTGFPIEGAIAIFENGTTGSPVVTSRGRWSVTEENSTTPEPSFLGLTLLGIGLAFLMRKRIGLGLPRAL